MLNLKFVTLSVRYETKCMLYLLCGCAGLVQLEEAESIRFRPAILAAYGRGVWRQRVQSHFHKSTFFQKHLLPFLFYHYHFTIRLE